MPAAPTAPPKEAPKASTVTIVDSGPPKPPPPPKTSINVSQMPSSADSPAPTKRGSAMRRISEALDAKAKTPGTSDDKRSAEADSSTAPQKEAAKSARASGQPAQTEGDETSSPESHSEPSPSTADDAGQGEESGTAEVGEDSAEETKAQTTQPAKGNEKVSPWKLVDQYKKQTAALEKQIADLRTQITPENDRKVLAERVEKAEKLSSQLADEIRYHNYERSPEFQEQFHAPYEAAFRRALEDLSEVTMTDAAGEQRKLSGDDLAQIALMGFVQAKETATRLFPDFANDIMAARKEIRSLWDKRQAALKDWKEKGAEREQQRIEQFQKAQSEIASHIRQTWEKANAEVAADKRHAEFFTPIEGDEEWNKRLAKGFELVDRSYTENPADPNLTPDQRAQVVKRHAAVRARAAGWAALRFRNEQLRAKIADLEKELAEYQSTTPKAAGTEDAPTTPSAPARAIDRLTQALGKYAH